MLIHAIENDFSTKRTNCHTFAEMSSRGLHRVASQAESGYQKRIWYLSRKPHPFKAQSQSASLTKSRFDTLILTGFSGGFVEVVA